MNTDGRFEYWECRMCGEKFKGGCQIVKLRLHSHFEGKHPKEAEELTFHKRRFAEEVEKVLKPLKGELRKRFPLANNSFCDFFRELPSPNKPRMWTCPDCGMVMKYHNKYYHSVNEHWRGK